MSKEPRKLESLPDILPQDLDDLWWSENVKVGMMADRHLESAIKKLENNAEGYEGSLTLKARWLNVLRQHQRERIQRRSIH